MGNSSNKTSIFSPVELLGNVQKQVPLQAQNINNTEVHELYSNSKEHHELIVQKIRTKKRYDCPNIIKIIDSHTVQSQGLCSTVIKTYIVIEKPKSLLQIIEKRIDNREVFQEKQIWNILGGCVEGLLFLIENNCKIKRLSTNTIYIDDQETVKIIDPEFTQSMADLQQIEQGQIIKSLINIVKNIINLGQKQIKYSELLSNFIWKNQYQKFTIIQFKKQIDLIRQLRDRQSYFSVICSKCTQQEPFTNFKNSCQNNKCLTVASNISQAKSSFSLSHTSQHSVKPSKKLKLDIIQTERLIRQGQDKQNSYTKNNKIKHHQKINRQLVPKTDINSKIVFKTDAQIDHFFPQKLNLNKNRSNKMRQFSNYTQPAIALDDKKLECNIVTYHIDQETSVSEVSRSQPAYLINFLDKSMSYIQEKNSEAPEDSRNKTEMILHKVL